MTSKNTASDSSTAAAPRDERPATFRAAVLGQPVSHSLSPVIHNAGYAALGLNEWEYSAFEVDAAGLPEFVSTADAAFRGFSVTMPGKFAALEYASEVTDRARLIGSANTLVHLSSGWRADNTDCEGVLGALEQLLGPVNSAPGDDSHESSGRAVLVGSGGTSRPALWALAQRGITRVDIVNRSDRTAELAPLADALGVTIAHHGFGPDAHQVISQLATDADVVVSTVPTAALEGYELALAHAPVLDVIYDRLPTPLMVAAAANGYPSVGGHVMLLHQALSQFEQFTGHPAPKDAMQDALDEALAQRARS